MTAVVSVEPCRRHHGNIVVNVGQAALAVAQINAGVAAAGPDLRHVYFFEMRIITLPIIVQREKPVLVHGGSGAIGFALKPENGARGVGHAGSFGAEEQAAIVGIHRAGICIVALKPADAFAEMRTVQHGNRNLISFHQQPAQAQSPLTNAAGAITPIALGNVPAQIGEHRGGGGVGSAEGTNKRTLVGIGAAVECERHGVRLSLNEINVAGDEVFKAPHRFKRVA